MAKKRIVVLFSGGWESTLCLLLAKKRNPTALIYAVYAEYGQPFLKEEFAAAQRIAEELKVGLISIEISIPQGTDSRVVSARNVRILLEAVDRYSPEEVYIGARAPCPFFDSFGDSNYSTLKSIGRSMGVRVRTLPPYPKSTIKAMVPAALHKFIYSTGN